MDDRNLAIHTSNPFSRAIVILAALVFVRNTNQHALNSDSETIEELALKAKKLLDA